MLMSTWNSLGYKTQSAAACATRRLAAALTLLCLLGAFTVARAQNPVPFVQQPLSPAAIAPGGAQFTLTVQGTGFASGATVNWNGTALATTFISNSKLTAIVPAGNIATAGTA